MQPVITKESPLGADLLQLMQRHTADMHADTPPESIYMMDAGQPVAMGAFKRLDATHAEIKSMHVLAEARGHGLSRLMLAHLIAEAKAAGLNRLSLETGIQPTFVAARALYANAGFATCLAFEGYWNDPNSVFMTRELA